MTTRGLEGNNRLMSTPDQPKPINHGSDQQSNLHGTDSNVGLTDERRCVNWRWRGWGRVIWNVKECSAVRIAPLFLDARGSEHIHYKWQNASLYCMAMWLITYLWGDDRFWMEKSCLPLDNERKDLSQVSSKGTTERVKNYFKLYQTRVQIIRNESQFCIFFFSLQLFWINVFWECRTSSEFNSIKFNQISCELA